MNSPADITIEKVRYHDLHDLERMFAKAFGEELNEERIKQRIRRIRQFYHLLSPLSNVSPWVKNLFNIYVFRKNDNVVGFIQVSHLNPRQLHLDFIAISRQYRGQGMGTWVLRKLLEQVADSQGKDVVLEVRTDNPAYRLYKRLGFTSQAQVLHYERPLLMGEQGVDNPPPLHGFRKLRAADRPKLYRLYQASISPKLQRVASRDHSEFNPSLFVRNMDRLKNYLMGNKRREYVLQRNGGLAASLELRSYPKARLHVVSMMLHPRYEYLREPILKQALYRLQKRYTQGMVSTTIYDDAVSKQKTLERLGFVRGEAYYLMFRPPRARAHSEVSVVTVGDRGASRRYYGGAGQSREFAIKDG